MPTLQEEYIREQIEWKEIPFSDNQPCIDLISQKPYGILRILDDQSCFPQVRGCQHWKVTVAGESPQLLFSWAYPWVPSGWISPRDHRNIMEPQNSLGWKISQFQPAAECPSPVSLLCPFPGH